MTPANQPSEDNPITITRQLGGIHWNYGRSYVYKLRCPCGWAAQENGGTRRQAQAAAMDHAHDRHGLRRLRRYVR